MFFSVSLCAIKFSFMGHLGNSKDQTVLIFSIRSIKSKCCLILNLRPSIREIQVVYLLNPKPNPKKKREATNGKYTC